MSGRFLIAGLPRCRTAWLSVATTTASSFCYHEPVAHLDSFEALVDLWKPIPGHAAGVSDSCLSLQLERILETVKPRVLLVERPLMDIVASFRKYLSGCEQAFDYTAMVDDLVSLQREMDRFRHHPNVRTLAFGEMTSYKTVLESLRWLIPDTDFPDLHGLMHMNIQVDRAYAINLAAKPHTHWHREKWQNPQSLAEGGVSQ